MERRNNRLNRYAIGPILKVYHFFPYKKGSENLIYKTVSSKVF